MAFCGVTTARGQTNLGKGHLLLLQHGLQIQAQAFDTTGTFDLNQWAGTYFTTVNWQWGANPPLMGTAPGIPWGRWSDFSYHTPNASEIPYLTNYVSLQIWDEPNLGDSTMRQQLATWFAQTRANFPNTLLFTDLQGHTNTNAQIAGFMAESQPDMLMYDSYPVNRNTTIVGGSLKYIYEDMATFRAHGLAGNDGTGAHPIPVGHYLQNFTDDSSTRFLSESEMRDQQFAGWTFGEKFESSFVYDSPPAGSGVTPQFFTGLGDANPTPALALQAESNRESRNLGPALVRLISTDVRYFPGQHKDSTGAIVTDATPAGMQTWQAGAGDPYLKSVTAVNLGTKNDGLRGDVLVGWFKVLDESFDGPAQDQVYFMVLNGLTDANGTAADCQQRITLTWNFGNTGITSLERLNRNTGQIDEIALTPLSGPLFAGQMSLTFTLDGGTADLFKFDTGAPFVGIQAVPEPATGLAGIVLLIGLGSRRRRRI